jgi:Spy/CpxP family protein refolding chaperone
MRSLHLASLALVLTISSAPVCVAQSTSASPAPATPGTQSAPSRLHRHARYRELFRGVQLTADQKQKVKSIHRQYRSQARTIHQQMRTARTTLRGADASRDTAAVSAARAQMKSARTQFSSLRNQWVSDTRATLTPEQQTQFDANIAAMKTERHQNRQKA